MDKRERVEESTGPGYVATGPESAADNPNEKKPDPREGYFQALFARHNAVMLLVEPESGRIVDANFAAARFYGYRRSILSSMNIADVNLLDPEEIARERELARKEERNYFVFPHRLSNGEVRTVEVHSTPIEVQGQVLLFSIIHDVTDRRKVEEELIHYREHLEELVEARTAELEAKNRLLTREIADRKRAEETAMRLAAIVESSDDAIIGKTLDGTIVSWNRGAEKVYGYSETEALGRSISFLVPPDRQEDLAHILGKIKAGDHVSHYETKRRRKDGAIIDVSVTVSPTLNSDGEIIGASTIARDISDHKRAEEALQESEHRQSQLAYELEVIIDSFPGLIFYKDKENRFLRVNRYLAESYSMTKEEMQGRNCFEMFPREVAQAYWDDDLEVIAGKEAKLNIEEKWDSPEGARWLLTSKIPFFDRSGNVVGVIGISQDITDHRQAEKEKERLFGELTEALSKVKILGGLLRICSSCKKIYNDKGQWEHLELYIRDHSEADFSHGICPECAEKLYPDYFSRKKKE